jgi:hypothetical protein
MHSLDLSLLASRDGKGRSLSVGHGNSHIVIKLTQSAAQIVEFLKNYDGDKGSAWMAIGTFGPYSASLYCSKEHFSIIVDGDECGDGSNQSFATYFAFNQKDAFIHSLEIEAAKQ